MKPLHLCSRQYRWQIKQKKKGKCIICDKPRINANHCAFHSEKSRQRYSPKVRKNRSRYSEPPGLHIGGTIRAIRLEKGLSAGVVAEQLGNSPSALSAIEYGRVTPSFPILEKLAQIFGMKLSRLMQRHEERMGL